MRAWTQDAPSAEPSVDAVHRAELSTQLSPSSPKMPVPCPLLRPALPIVCALQCPLRSLSTTGALRAMTDRGSHLPKHLIPPHAQIPAYPHGPSRIYKQSNKGLYGTAKIRFGNNVSSETETKTRRAFRPNVLHKALYSLALRKKVKLRVTARVLRTIDKVGGLDEYLLGDNLARIKELGETGWKLRWVLLQKPAIQERMRVQARALGFNEDTIQARWGTPPKVERIVVPSEPPLSPRLKRRVRAQSRRWALSGKVQTREQGKALGIEKIRGKERIRRDVKKLLWRHVAKTRLGAQNEATEREEQWKRIEEEHRDSVQAEAEQLLRDRRVSSLNDAMRVAKQWLRARALPIKKKARSTEKLRQGAGEQKPSVKKQKQSMAKQALSPAN